MSHRFFWIFNISFWLYLALSTISIGPASRFVSRDLFLLFLFTSSGILFSYLFHVFVYERYKFHQLKLGLLIALVIEYSLLFAVLRDYCSHLLTYISHGFIPKGNSPYDHLPSVLRYWFNFMAWSGIYFTYRLHRQWTEEKQSVQQAQLTAKEAQLAALRYQLNPHFLFNTLSSLRVLTTRNPQKAKEVIANISEFLRYTLSEHSEPEVTLNREIEIIKYYLDIENIHYGDSFIAAVNVDKEAGNIKIPTFLIHPLVENAVKYGVQTSAPPVKIEINIQSVNKEIRISVENSGHWIDEGNKTAYDGTGTGLSNVNHRLKLFFPEKHKFEIIKNEKSVAVLIYLTGVVDNAGE